MKVWIAVLLFASSVVLPANAQGSAGLPSAAEYRMALAGKKWLRVNSVDKTTGGKSVTFTVFATGFPIDYKAKPPSATVICGERTIMYPTIQAGSLSSGYVIFTFDNGMVLKQVLRPLGGNFWWGSESDQVALLNAFATAKSFKLEYMPAAGPPKVVNFSMADYQDNVLKEPLCRSQSSGANTPSAGTGLNTPDMQLAGTKDDVGMPTVAEYQLAAAGKKWLRVSSVDKTTGEKSVTFTIFATGFPVDYKGKQPSASVLCGGTLGMYPVIQTGPLNDGNVRLTLDDGTVVKQVWRPRSNHWVGSESDQVELLKAWATAKSFKFEYTPAGGQPKTINFSLADYKDSVLKDPTCKK